jgi:MoxR-like ATPase
MPDDPSAQDPRTHQALLDVERAVTAVVRGNAETVRMALAAIVAGGHVLLEDVPGVGKTTLARVLARTLGCTFSRIQFTADLLPSDVIGVQVLDTATGALAFRRGPIFAHVVLADEINRASPKTQSALLEAMADLQISVDDETHTLPPPFCVLATQNPVEHHGAYPLPESQLDRFLVRLSLGYPPRDAERALLMEGRTAEQSLKAVNAILDPERVRALQQSAAALKLSEPVASYLLTLVEGTRTHPRVELGCSTRGAIGWAALCRARAFLDGRPHVLPDDVKHTARAVLAHRLGVRGVAEGAEARRSALAVVDELLERTPAPR